MTNNTYAKNTEDDFCTFYSVVILSERSETIK